MISFCNGINFNCLIPMTNCIISIILGFSNSLLNIFYISFYKNWKQETSLMHSIYILNIIFQNFNGIGGIIILFLKNKYLLKLQNSIIKILSLIFGIISYIFLVINFLDLFLIFFNYNKNMLQVDSFEQTLNYSRKDAFIKLNNLSQINLKNDTQNNSFFIDSRESLIFYKAYNNITDEFNGGIASLFPSNVFKSILISLINCIFNFFSNKNWFSIKNKYENLINSSISFKREKEDEKKTGKFVSKSIYFAIFTLLYIFIYASVLFLVAKYVPAQIDISYIFTNSIFEIIFLGFNLYFIISFNSAFLKDKSIGKYCCKFFSIIFFLLTLVFLIPSLFTCIINFVLCILGMSGKTFYLFFCESYTCDGLFHYSDPKEIGFTDEVLNQKYEYYYFKIFLKKSKSFKNFYIIIIFFFTIIYNYYSLYLIIKILGLYDNRNYVDLILYYFENNLWISFNNIKISEFVEKIKINKNGKEIEETITKLKKEIVNETLQNIEESNNINKNDSSPTHNNVLTLN